MTITHTAMVTVRQLLREDELNPRDCYELHDALWMPLSEAVHPPPAADWPDWARIFVAQSWAEGEMGNGGLAQAMLNVGDWLPLAALAYQAQGLQHTAQLLLDCADWLAQQSPPLNWDSLDHLSESAQAQLHALCKRFEALDEDDWNVCKQRVAVLRALHAQGGL